MISSRPRVQKLDGVNDLIMRSFFSFMYILEIGMSLQTIVHHIKLSKKSLSFFQVDVPNLVLIFNWTPNFLDVITLVIWKSSCVSQISKCKVLVTIIILWHGHKYSMLNFERVCVLKKSIWGGLYEGTLNFSPYCHLIF
jgi:hypothetical protein